MRERERIAEPGEEGGVKLGENESREVFYRGGVTVPSCRLEGEA